MMEGGFAGCRCAFVPVFMNMNAEVTISPGSTVDVTFQTLPVSLL
jgi:hypothetical protein